MRGVSGFRADPFSVPRFRFWLFVPECDDVSIWFRSTGRADDTCQSSY